MISVPYHHDHTVMYVFTGHWVGDPCEFGLLTVCTSNEVHEVGQQFGDVHSQQLLTGMGMNTSFTRLVAEAYYQGNSLLMTMRKTCLEMCFRINCLLN